MNDSRLQSQGGLADTVVAVAAPPVTPAPSRQAEGGPAWTIAARGLLRQPRFVVAAAFLLVAAVGLNAATQFLQLHFRKLAVPLRVKSLSDADNGFPAVLGPIGAQWAQATVDEPLDPDVEGALGTKQYINRVYVDTRLDRHAAGILHGGSKSDREQRLNDFVRDYSRDLNGAPQVPALTVSMTYYTGLVDTVAHIPERCYVASGYQQVTKDVESVPSDSNARDVNFTLIHFDDESGQEHGVFVAYFFQVNGKYTENPIEVRKTLQDLTEKYGYYAKIEIKAAVTDRTQAVTPEYRAAVERAIRSFIEAALPDIERCLPDWQQVKAGGK